MLQKEEMFGHIIKKLKMNRAIFFSTSSVENWRSQVSG